MIAVFIFTIIIILALLLSVFVTDFLLILLKIKKSKSKKVVGLSLHYLKEYNRIVTFYESPVFTQSFAVVKITPQEVKIVVSSDFLLTLDNQDFKEVINNSIIMYEKRTWLFKVYERSYSILLIIPYIIINLPSLFFSRRLYIIEKFFSLPIFQTSMILSRSMANTQGAHKSAGLRFNSKSMLERVDENFLGPHLLFYLNSSYYKILRDRKSGEA